MRYSQVYVGLVTEVHMNVDSYDNFGEVGKDAYYHRPDKGDILVCTKITTSKRQTTWRRQHDGKMYQTTVHTSLKPSDKPLLNTTRALKAMALTAQMTQKEKAIANRVKTLTAMQKSQDDDEACLKLLKKKLTALEKFETDEEHLASVIIEITKLGKAADVKNVAKIIKKSGLTVSSCE
jgi:hypothetical protein